MDRGLAPYEQFIEKLNNRKIDILGVTYTIHIYGPYKESRFDKERGLEGFSSCNAHQIHILDKTDDIRCCPMFPTEWYINDVKHTLRHEIIHSFLSESGLKHQSHETPNWSQDEELVDWFATQSPKIFQVFQELGILEFSEVHNNPFYGEVSD